MNRPTGTISRLTAPRIWRNKRSGSPGRRSGVCLYVMNVSMWSRCLQSRRRRCTGSGHFSVKYVSARMLGIYVVVRGALRRSRPAAPTTDGDRDQSGHLQARCRL